MRRSDWTRLATLPGPRPAPPPRQGEDIGVGGETVWGWGGGAAPGVTGLLWGRGPACCTAQRCAVLGAPLRPCSTPTPPLTQSPAGGGPGPFAPRVCGSRADAALRGKGVRGAARCGIPGVLLALPGARHVERPSPAPLGRAGTGDPGRDERDTGPSSLLMSASGRDRLLPVATRPSALGPARATGNATGATGHC